MHARIGSETPGYNLAPARVLRRIFDEMIRPRSFSLGIERQVVCIRTTGFHGFTADGGLHTSRAPASSVATRRRWVEPQGRLSDPWGFAFRSSTGFARVEVVNFSPICTPTYGVARCLRVRNRCLELGGSGVGSRTSTSSSQLLARCGPLRRFHHSGESLLARVPARTWLETPSPAAVGSIASAGYRTQLLHPFVLQNPNHLDIVTAGLEGH